MKIQDFKLLLPFKKYLEKGNLTPVFLFEKRILIQKGKEYLSAIKKQKAKVKPFYAIKSNDYLGVLKTLVGLGFGLDASSGRELRLAKKTNANDVIFTGPSKTEEDIFFGLKNFRNFIINVDSFEELEKIKKINLKKQIHIGVRINTKLQGPWKRFGIPLNSLKKFSLEVKKEKNIKLIGIQFHNSWNQSSRIYIQTLRILKNYLLKNFLASEIKDLEFIDIGGGLYSNKIEKYLKAKDAIQSQDINLFFKDINNFYQKNLKEDFPDLVIFTEPGRWLSTHCFHILLKVSDIKDKKSIILDGGTDNFVFSTEKKYYYPVLNLSHPSNKEKKVILCGSLCSVYDSWGYSIFASKIKIGDIILIPFQGAYTYSLASDFIEPLANVIELK
jgi:diaminopimelate decarboxylase